MEPDSIFIPQDGEFCELDFTATFRRTQASDQQQRSTWIINTADMDSYRTVIPPDNGDLSRYRKNPVVLINHSYSLQAGESRVSKRGTGKQARIEANMRDGDVADGGNWDLDDPEIMRYYRKVQKGLMKGASIGFRAKWKRTLREGGDPEKWSDYYYVAESWELFEWSIVTVPANPKTLKTGRMLARMGRHVPEAPTQILVPDTKLVTSGLSQVMDDQQQEWLQQTITQAGYSAIPLMIDPNHFTGVDPVQDGEDRSAPDQPIEQQEEPDQEDPAEDQAQADPDASRSTDESSTDEGGEEASGTDHVVLVPTELLIHAACGGREALDSLQHLVMIYGTGK